MLTERQVLFALKGINLGLISTYQFLLIYVLTRVVGADVFPLVVFLAAMGNYVLGTDLGFSGYVYAQVRQKFVQGRTPETFGLMSGGMTLYFTTPLICFLAAIVVIPLTFDAPAAIQLGLVLYFGSIIFSLPWQLIRNILTAIDLFVAMETMELARRLLFVGLTAAMLAGLSFTLFAALCLVAWIVSFAVALILIRRRGVEIRALAPLPLLRFVAAHRRQITTTGTFGGLEFILYNSPYLLIPAMNLGGQALVFFDLFFKLTRFSGMAFNVPIDSALPYQTRAYYEGHMGEVTRYHRQLVLMGLPIFAGAAAFLLLYGQWFFDLLLHDFPPVEPWLIHAMIAMMFCILIQCTAGRFLVAIGRHATLVRLAVIALAIAGATSLAVWALGLDFAQFMTLYVACYAVYALLYLYTFRRVVREPHLASEPLAPKPTTSGVN